MSDDMIQQECKCGGIEFFVYAKDEGDYKRIYVICRECGTEYEVKSTSCSRVFVELENVQDDE